MQRKGKYKMFLKVGHRGARAYETENTLESFKKAIELGANAIELDVRQSGDKKLIILHDDNLKKVFGKDLPVNMATIEELKQLTASKVPTLEEALLFIDKKVDKILVELKEAGHEKKALDVIRKQRLEDRVIFVSFHEESLEKMNQLDSKIETGLIYARFMSKIRSPAQAAMKLNARYLVPLYRLVHTKDIEKAHENNLKVIVWTINTKKEAREYIAKGVDGIASDKPDIFKGIA